VEKGKERQEEREEGFGKKRGQVGQLRISWDNESKLGSKSRLYTFNNWRRRRESSLKD